MWGVAIATVSIGVLEQIQPKRSCKIKAAPLASVRRQLALLEMPFQWTILRSNEINSLFRK
jgi:hypothetical protein